MAQSRQAGPEASGTDSSPPPPRDKRDFRAVIVALGGLVVIAVIAVLAFILSPGDVPVGRVNNKGQNIVAVASAAITAVGTVISAYFGVKAANVAREDSSKAAERHEIRSSALAGAASREDAARANEAATNQIRRLGI